ncbi:MAG TPA: glycosyltransferase family 39 protein [Candidatus Dormibacteraeota bacterium]|nr:glycosyltransferase family 39 protein [Candidatus Dormibacteraeota bacterium]
MSSTADQRRVSTIRPSEAQNRFTSGPAIVLYIVAAKLLLHLLTVARYGIFRDEMYYLACSRHMAWGYVDHPPLTVWIAWFSRVVLGDSPLGVRLLPILAGAAVVWLAGTLAREMGGGRFAQGMAALAVVVVPIYLVAHTWLTDNVFEQLIWMGCVWLVVRAINTGDARYWLWFGVVAGLGFENKYSIAFLLLGLLAGVAFTPHRHFLKSRYLWLGVLACAAISLPNLLWEIRNHFPFLELIHNIRLSDRDVVRAPVAFIADQAMIMNPVLFPLWLGGLVWLLAVRDGRRYRLLGFTYLVVLAAFIALKAKNYYVAPIYPILFAAGAIGLERMAQGRRIGTWVRSIYVALVIVVGVVLMPFSVPVFSPENFLRYQKALGFKPSEFEHQQNGPLPQWFADEFGWQEMVEKVATIYKSLPPEERARTAIFSNSWGEAAAVDFYGPRYGLPQAISRHNSYWMWGPGKYDGSTMIILQSDGRGDREHFQSVETVGRVEHPYSRRDEYFDIYLCRGLKVNLQDVWPKLKHFD